MKRVEIEFEVTDDGEIVTYRVPGEVPGEIHDELESALADLEKLLGTVIDRRSIRPGFTRRNRLHRRQHLGGHHHHD